MNLTEIGWLFRVLSKCGFVYVDGTWHDFEVDRVVAPIINSQAHAVKQNLPFIVWWTPFTGERGRIKRCYLGDCFFSQNHSLYSNDLVQAFMFYGTDFDENDLPIPRKRNHEWALLHEESPKNRAIFYHDEAITLFNHTCTFKQQSSYPISTQYINSAEYLLKPVTYTTQERDQLMKNQSLAPIAYIQSGCNPPSDRDAYVQELMKFIKIDSYGKCLHNKDLPENLKDPLTMFDKAYLKFIEKYKFIISFENALCDDYMTEKIFRTIHVGSVPIYLGASNLREWLPDANSVIMVEDFSSPEQLANHIHFLNNNQNEYDKLLAYKTLGIKNAKLENVLKSRKWGINTSRKLNYITGFECHVCDQIHRNKKLIEQGKHPKQHIATRAHYDCPKPTMFPFPSIPNSEDWEREVWQWDFSEGKKKALKLLTKVVSN